MRKNFSISPDANEVLRTKDNMSQYVCEAVLFYDAHIKQKQQETPVIIVAANPELPKYESYFTKYSYWGDVKLSPEMIKRINSGRDVYVAIYNTKGMQPAQAIERYIKVTGFRACGTKPGYGILELDRNPIQLTRPIPLGYTHPRTLSIPRITTLQKLQAAEVNTNATIQDLLA